jgi:hypothetical protein
MTARRPASGLMSRLPRMATKRLLRDPIPLDTEQQTLLLCSSVVSNPSGDPAHHSSKPV